MFGSRPSMSASKVAAKCERAAELIREASALLDEVAWKASSETARRVSLAAAGVTPATADALDKLAAELDAEADAALNDDTPPFPLGFDTGGDPNRNQGADL